MRVLVVSAHPLPTSFVGSLRREVVETLRRGGGEIDDLDLYAENFNPVMSRETYVNYLNPRANRVQAGAYVERLLAAEALVLISPIWNDGFPAILKGFFDCVFLPGVSFAIVDGHLAPSLRNIKRLAAICTYGAGRDQAIALGNPQRRFVKRSLAAQIGPDGRVEFLGLYGLDAATPQTRARYLRRTARAFRAW